MCHYAKYKYYDLKKLYIYKIIVIIIIFLSISLDKHNDVSEGKNLICSQFKDLCTVLLAGSEDMRECVHM